MIAAAAVTSTTRKEIQNLLNWGLWAIFGPQIR